MGKLQPNRFKDKMFNFPSHSILHIENKESRIGKRPISIPKRVEIKLNGNKINAKGSKGERTLDVDHTLTVSLENEMITVTPKENGLRERQLHGLNRTLVKNLITGVSNGFEKKLCLVCVGFAHDVILPIPHGIDATVTQNTNIKISGI